MSAPLAAVSLVICTRERPQLVEKAIETVVRGDELPAEVVVVDQSAEPHPELSAEPVFGGCRIRYVHDGSIGLSAARNAGVAAATYEVLAFTDDDVIVPPKWLGTLLGPLLAGDRQIVVTGRVLPTEPEIHGGFQVGLKIDDAPAVYTAPGPRDVLVAGNMAMRRETLERVGPFDTRLGAGTRYPGAEDNDFGFRLLRAGCAIRYVPEAVLYHRVWRPRREYLAVRWRYGVGQGGFYGKVAVAGDAYAARRLPRHIGHYALRLPWRAVRHPRRALGDVVFVAGLVCGFGRWLTTERAR